MSSGISGASYYTGSFNTVSRSPDGSYVAVSSRGNFYLTWEPGQVTALPSTRMRQRTYEYVQLLYKNAFESPTVRTTGGLSMSKYFVKVLYCK